ncbi:family 76 putative glycoside hydrolase [Triangularia verruculosa]|uniref:Family 76 putative glycoside hydrolase n=1 Tax=Triangularia verruculosa TaxID=2587418 RepID=A0AAN6XNJ7_9PEZI|nr:family 76 putative glycoside hydrolase [Triangularia verruculosa]
MVSTRWGGLVARALFYMSSHRNAHIDAEAVHLANITGLAAKALQSWYSPTEGGWNTGGWWHDANCLTVLADWAIYSAPNKDVNVTGIIANTFVNAQKTGEHVGKRLSTTAQMASTAKYGANMKRGFPEFINEFYDDEGWWALAWIRSYDLTKNLEYLNMAERIFSDMQGGVDEICGGGIMWNKTRKYKAAIANELYLSVAASLANRVQGSRDKYLQIAKDQWTWFQNSGLINKHNLINDGLTSADGTCLNNKQPTWSYNQGVILGGLVELSKAAGNESYLAPAVDIAKAAIAALGDKEGIINEIDHCEPNCGDDGPQFKGIFIRNLHYLYKAVLNQDFAATIKKNADSIWAKNRDPETNRLGISWVGPPELGIGPTARTHSCAMDVLVAAMGVVAGNK